MSRFRRFRGYGTTYSRAHAHARYYSGEESTRRETQPRDFGIVGRRSVDPTSLWFQGVPTYKLLDPRWIFSRAGAGAGNTSGQAIAGPELCQTSLLVPGAGTCCCRPAAAFPTDWTCLPAARQRGPRAVAAGTIQRFLCQPVL